MIGRMRFAIIGTDHWYSAVPLAQRLATSPDAELVVVADGAIERAREVAALADARATVDLEAVLADGTVETVVSCVDSARNAEVCIRAAQAGKHIMSVKPMAMTLAAAERVVAAVESAGVVFVAAESRSRITPLGRYLRELGAGRRLGPVVSGALSLAGNMPVSWPGSEGPGWWADPLRTPGGGWIDHAIYHVDRMRWTLGAEVASISGRIARLAHAGLEVEDYGHAVAEFTDGSLVAIEDGWAASVGAARTSVTLAGSEGSVAFDSLSGQLSRFDAGEWTYGSVPDDDPSELAPLVEHFRDPVSGLGGVRDAWDNLATCLAFYESASAAATVVPQRRTVGGPNLTLLYNMRMT